VNKTQDYINPYGGLVAWIQRKIKLDRSQKNKEAPSISIMCQSVEKKLATLSALLI
jgi:hypothetical protein